eukprot:2276468-Rhodomonas_salina.2
MPRSTRCCPSPNLGTLARNCCPNPRCRKSSLARRLTCLSVSAGTPAIPAEAVRNMRCCGGLVRLQVCFIGSVPAFTTSTTTSTSISTTIPSTTTAAAATSPSSSKTPTTLTASLRQIKARINQTRRVSGTSIAFSASDFKPSSPRTTVTWEAGGGEREGARQNEKGDTRRGRKTGGGRREAPEGRKGGGGEKVSKNHTRRSSPLSVPQPNRSRRDFGRPCDTHFARAGASEQERAQTPCVEITTRRAREPAGRATPDGTQMVRDRVEGGRGGPATVLTTASEATPRLGLESSVPQVS